MVGVGVWVWSWRYQAARTYIATHTYTHARARAHTHKHTHTPRAQPSKRSCPPRPCRPQTQTEVQCLSGARQADQRPATRRLWWRWRLPLWLLCVCACVRVCVCACGCVLWVRAWWWTDGAPAGTNEGSRPHTHALHTPRTYTHRTLTLTHNGPTRG